MRRGVRQEASRGQPPLLQQLAHFAAVCPLCSAWQPAGLLVLTRFPQFPFMLPLGCRDCTLVLPLAPLYQPSTNLPANNLPSLGLSGLHRLCLAASPSAACPCNCVATPPYCSPLVKPTKPFKTSLTTIPGHRRCRCCRCRCRCARPRRRYCCRRRSCRRCPHRRRRLRCHLPATAPR